jgi:hypothetical protein
VADIDDAFTKKIFHGQKQRRKRYMHNHGFEDVLGARLKVIKELSFGLDQS